MLIPLVLGIWGLIAFRIFKAVEGNNTPSYVSAPTPVFNEEVEKRDTYELKLNYRDPFLRKLYQPPAAKTAEKKPKKVTVKKTVTKIPLKWPELNYKGTITKSDSRELLCIVEINRQVFFLRRNEIQGDVKLLEIYEDSVRVSYRGKEKKVITKQSS